MAPRYNTLGNSGYSNVAINIDTITVSGDISSATTWSFGHVYVLDGSVTVNTGITLAVEPGVIIKFKTTTSLLTVSGTLNAQGTAGSNIYFTSYLDDSVGGDTNGDTTSTSPAADNWDKIKVNASGTATIENAVIRYGTGAAVDVLIWNNGGNLTISSSEVATGTLTTAYGIYASSGTTTITSTDIHGFRYGIEKESGSLVVSTSNMHNNDAYGVFVTGGATTLTDNTFSGNASGAAYIDIGGQNVSFTHSGNTASGTGVKGFRISGEIGSSQTWNADGIPYVVSALSVPSGKTLTLDPGVVIKFNSASEQLAVTGTLNAQGTSGSKIYFTSLHDLRAAGNRAILAYSKWRSDHHLIPPLYLHAEGVRDSGEGEGFFEIGGARAKIILIHGECGFAIELDELRAARLRGNTSHADGLPAMVCLNRRFDISTHSKTHNGVREHFTVVKLVRLFKMQIIACGTSSQGKTCSH